MNRKDQNAIGTDDNDISIVSKLGIDINTVLIFPGAGGPDQFMEELESKINTCTSTSTNEEDTDTAIDHANGKRTTMTIVHTFD